MEGESNIGPVVGIVIVVIILFTGGAYFFQNKLETSFTPPSPAAHSSGTQTKGPSEDSQTIQSDLNSVSTSSLDAELPELDKIFK